MVNVGSVKPEVTAFFDEPTNTISYVVKDPASNACAVVDSVMDIDYAAGRITYDGADKIIAFVKEKGLTVEWLIETHVHADHLSAAPYIQKKLGGKLGIGDKITVVQETFGKIFNEGTEFQRDGSPVRPSLQGRRHLHRRQDAVLRDAHARSHAGLHDPCHGRCGLCRRHALHAGRRHGARRLSGRRRGHASTSRSRRCCRCRRRRASSCATTTARTAATSAGKPPSATRSAHNIHVRRRHDRRGVRRRCAPRATRTLDMPKLIIPSLQVNMRAGDLPPPDESGKRFLKVPVNTL